MKEYQFKIPCWVDIDAESEGEAVTRFRNHLHLLDDSLAAPGPFKRVQVDTAVYIDRSNIVEVFYRTY